MKRIRLEAARRRLRAGVIVCVALTAVIHGAIAGQERADRPSTSTGAEDGSLQPRGPLPPPGFLESCLQLIKEGRHAEARARLLPVVGDHPGWARARFFLGLTYHEEHRYEEASTLFHRVLEIDPQYTTAKVFLGWCLYYLGDLAASRELFESYLEVNPDYADAIFALGLIDFDGDEIDSARTRFLKTIRLAQAQQSTSTEAKARARLADVMIRLDEWRAAKEQLQRSIELNPGNHESYFKLSRVLRRLGDGEGAEQALRKYHEILDRKRPAAPPGEGTAE